MSWAFAPAAVAWLIGIPLVHLLGSSLVGDSPVGRKCVPIVALAWPVALILLLVVCGVSAWDLAFDRSLNDALGPDDGDAA